VLLALLCLIAAAVLWFTAGRDVVASFLDDRADPEGSAPTDTGPTPEEAGTGSGDDPADHGPGQEDEEPDPDALANPVECLPEALTVDLSPTGTYPLGEEMRIDVTVANTGSVPCLVDLGHESMRIDITSGSDDIWDSRQCPSDDAQRDLLLDIDAQVDHTLTWDGERCGSSSDLQEGNYRISVQVPATGGVARAEAAVKLTD